MKIRNDKLKRKRISFDNKFELTGLFQSLRYEELKEILEKVIFCNGSEIAELVFYDGLIDMRLRDKQ